MSIISYKEASKKPILTPFLPISKNSPSKPAPRDNSTTKPNYIKGKNTKKSKTFKTSKLNSSTFLKKSSKNPNFSLFFYSIFIYFRDNFEEKKQEKQAENEKEEEKLQEYTDKKLALVKTLSLNSNQWVLSKIKAKKRELNESFDSLPELNEDEEDQE